MWTVGHNKHGQIGRKAEDNNDDNDKEPRLVMGLLGVAVDVDCGWSHCAVKVVVVRENNNDDNDNDTTATNPRDDL